jgi:hypothetical protein
VQTSQAIFALFKADQDKIVALNNLRELGIVKDISGSGKERLYIYTALIDLLERGAAQIALKENLE